MDIETVINFIASTRDITVQQVRNAFDIEELGESVRFKLKIEVYHKNKTRGYEAMGQLFKNAGCIGNVSKSGRNGEWINVSL